MRLFFLFFTAFSFTAFRTQKTKKLHVKLLKPFDFFEIVLRFAKFPPHFVGREESFCSLSKKPLASHPSGGPKGFF